MPTYDYQCRDCNAVTEVIHSMLEDGPSVCERCGGQLRRILYPTGIIFKGSGFYKTDSRASTSNGTGGTTDAAPPASTSEKPSSSAGDAAGTKPDATSS